MTIAAYVFIALILAPLASWGTRHAKAWWRAKRYVWPPMTVIEVSDTIPF